jgi:branched-chain amino acid transport system permease protein
MLAMQILVDGFVIGAIYGLGAIGFTIIFGVSGVLNLAHGGILVTAAMVAWWAALAAGRYWGMLAGIGAAIGITYLTYYVVVRPIKLSRKIPEVEKDIFILTATLLWAIMIEEGIAYLFTANPITVLPLISGVTDFVGVRTPTNELLIGVICWLVIALLWLFVNHTKLGKSVLAAAINPRGLALLGFNLERIYVIVWGLYGLLAGIAGVLLATFIGASATAIGDLTASAFSIVVLGGLGSVPGSLIAAYVIGYVETATAYLVTPSIREMPALMILILVLYVRPQGLLGRR